MEKDQDKDKEKNSFSSADSGEEKGSDGFVKPEFGGGADISGIYVKPNFDGIAEASADEIGKNDIDGESAPDVGDESRNDGEGEVDNRQQSETGGASEAESGSAKNEESNNSGEWNGSQNDNGRAYNPNGYGNSYGGGNSYGNGYGNGNRGNGYGNGGYGNGGYGGYGGYNGAENGQNYGNYRGNYGYGQFGGQPMPPPKKKNAWLVPVAIALCVIMCIGCFAFALRLSSTPPPSEGSNSQTEGGNNGGDSNGGSGEGGGDKSPFLGNGSVELETLPSDSVYYTIPSVVEATQNTVVEIVTESKTTGNIWGQYVQTGAGSGVIIKSYPEKGTSGACGTYIITNEHVISGAFSIKVKLNNGKEYEAALVAADAQTDIAVIHIDEASLPVAQFGRSDELKAGETVVIIGNPLGSLGGSVSSGIISCTERNIVVGDNVMKLIQTTAAVNPGNSGGAMFDLTGKLVGVVNAKYSAEEIEGIGFAIPSNTASSVAEDLINYGYVKGRPNHGMDFYYGVCAYRNTYVNFNGERVNGLWASVIAKGSDTQKAGLKEYDQIVSVIGTDSLTYTFSSVSQANAFFDSLKVGDVITVNVYRYTPSASMLGTTFVRENLSFNITITEYTA